MDATHIVLNFEPVLDVAINLIEAVPIGIIDEFFFQRSHEAFCQTVLSRFASITIEFT